jgi:hypothetical protein
MPSSFTNLIRYTMRIGHAISNQLLVGWQQNPSHLCSSSLKTQFPATKRSRHGKATPIMTTGPMPSQRQHVHVRRPPICPPKLTATPTRCQYRLYHNTRGVHAIAKPLLSQIDVVTLQFDTDYWSTIVEFLPSAPSCRGARR